MANEQFLINKDLGDKLKAHGDLSGAVRAYEEAIRERPQFWGAYYEKADAQLRQNDYLEAAHSFILAWLHSRNRPEPMLMCGRALLLGNMFDEAIEVFRLIDLQSYDPTSALMYANALTAAGRSSEAFKLKPLIEKSTDLTIKQRVLAYMYRGTGNLEDAKNLFQQILKREPNSIKDLDSLANIELQSGNSQKAIGLYKEAITKRLMVARLDLKSSARINTKQKKPMLVFAASEALLLLKEILDKNNVEFFLAYGTLLGIYRDGEILPYDKDLDLGLKWDVDRVALIELFKDNEHFKVKHQALDSAEKNKWNIVLQHRKSDITIDLFFFKPEGSHYLSGFFSRASLVLWKFDKFALGEIEYRGEKFNSPESPEKFFTQIYGSNWRIPDKYFDSVLSGYNLIEDSLPYRLANGYAKVFGQIDRSDYVKAGGYLAQVRRMTDDPWLDNLDKELVMIQETIGQQQAGSADKLTTT